MRPILFSVFSLPIYGYGVMLGLSVFVGCRLALHLAERDGLDAVAMRRCCLYTLAAALVGARLLFVATNPGQFPGLLDVLRVYEGGMVAYGGFLGGFFGSVI